MVSSSKAKGSAYERAVREYLRDMGLRVDHLKLNGTDDMGDLYVHGLGKGHVLELKNVARINLPDFLRQAELERNNYAKAHRLGEFTAPTFDVVVKARNKPVGQSFVVTTLDEWIDRG